MTPLSAFLKDTRHEKGLSLRQVEGKSGLSFPYLSQLENGKIAQPSPTVLKKLADVYEVSYSLLMQLAGYPVETNEKDQGQIANFLKTSAAFLEGGSGKKILAFIVAAIAVVAGVYVYSQHLGGGKTPPVKPPVSISNTGASAGVDIIDPQFNVVSINESFWASNLFVSHQFTNTSLTIVMNDSWAGLVMPQYQSVYLYRIVNTLSYNVTLNFTIDNLPLWTAFSYSTVGPGNATVGPSYNYTGNVSANTYFSYVLSYQYSGNGTIFNVLWNGVSAYFQAGSEPNITGATMVGYYDLYGTAIVGNGSVVVPAYAIAYIRLYDLSAAYVSVNNSTKLYLGVQTLGVPNSTQPFSSTTNGSAKVSI